MTVRAAGLKACSTTLCVAALVACHASVRPASPAPASPTHPASAVLDRLKSDVDAILGDPALGHGSWGVLVKSLKTDETLYAVNARRLMLPASNMKIVTLAAAADRLGWDFTYETTLLTAGSIDAGVLRGDLIVVGSGDPSIGEANDSARLFSEWADRLKALGVSAVSGRVIGDDHAFSDEELGFGWSWDDIPDDYSAGISALQYDENAVRVTVTPGPAAGDWAGVSVAPPDSGLAIDSAIRTSTAGGPTTIDARRLPGSSKLTLSGSLPLGAPPVTRAVSVDNPTQFFVNTLRRALIERGIDIRGPAVDVDDAIDAPARKSGTTIATHRSAPLSTLALRLMKISQNQYAETFLKTLGARAGRPTAAGGRTAAQAALQAWGVGPDALIQRDGSGLSRYDYVTPEALVTILVHVDRDARLKAPFEASLPVAGGEGLRTRMKGTRAEGNARAKTGSMTSVRSLSGYVDGADGEPLVFAIIANNFETPPATINQATDAIVVRLAEFRR